MAAKHLILIRIEGGNIPHFGINRYYWYLVNSKRLLLACPEIEHSWCACLWAYINGELVSVKYPKLASRYQSHFIEIACTHGTKEIRVIYQVLNEIDENSICFSSPPFPCN